MGSGRDPRSGEDEGRCCGAAASGRSILEQGDSGFGGRQRLHRLSTLVLAAARASLARLPESAGL